MKKTFLITAGFFFVLIVGLACSGTASVPATEAAPPPTETDPPAPTQEPPTVTSTLLPPTATPTIEPSPTVTKVVIAQDDFSDPDSGWEHYREADGVLDYENEGYRLYVNTDQNMFWVNAGQELTDVQIEVDVQKQAGPEADRFGVICRLDMQSYNYYLFVINGQGEYGIGIWENRQLTLLGDGAMKTSEAIQTGNAANHISAGCVGNELWLGVNGVELMRVQDDRLASGDVGLVAGTYGGAGIDVLFDNWVLLEP
jgi:hypothetical protein